MIRLLFLLFAALIPTSPLAAEVVRVDNPAQPLDGTSECQLVEQWRAGADDEEVFFGNVLQVLPAPEGGLYVLDSQRLTVFYFAADGTLIRELGRRGEGPGEVNNMNSMVTMPDGSLGLGQVLPGKVVQVAPDGTPVGSIRITAPDAQDSGFVLYMGGIARADMLIATVMRWRMDSPPTMVQEMSLRRYNLDGVTVTDYLNKQTDFDTQNFVFTEIGYDFVWSRFDLLPDGRICVAPERNAYEIRIHAPGGELERIITRPYESWQRTKAEREEAHRSITAIGSHYGRELQDVKVEDTEADISGLRAMADGSLWVRTSRGDRNRPDGILTTLDVYDPEGNYVRQLSLRAPGDPKSDAIHLLADGRVVVVVGAVEAYRREQDTSREQQGEGADVAVEVICYGD